MKPPVSALPQSVAVLRRSSLQGGRKPPPPIRRTSSMASSVPLLGHQPGAVAAAVSSSVSSTSTSGIVEPLQFQLPSTSSRPSAIPGSMRPSSTHRKTLSDTTMQRISEAGMSSSVVVAVASGIETVEELPGYESQWSPAPERPTRPGPPLRQLSDTHAEIIQTLNQQFTNVPISAAAAAIAVHPAGRRLQRPSSTDAGRIGSGGSGDGRPPGRGILIAQIQEGVTLRRASTNDRSAPTLRSRNSSSQ